jgi:type I restriction enzyme M protein
MAGDWLAGWRGVCYSVFMETERKALLKSLKFSPKEESESVFQKKYAIHSNYTIEVDFKLERIDYGNLIKCESKTTQNFSQAENWVVLECVNRLLEKGYAPQKIILEKTYPAGHGVTKRLDILLLDNNARNAYAMIECKTYGAEFENELKNIQKDGGQLFSYFQQDTKAELLILYTSCLMNGNIASETKIIKVTDEYRKTGSVKNVYKLFDGAFYETGFWEHHPYNFEIRKSKIADLKELTEAEGNKLFNGFASILRKHSVSDKPNAFNVIFNLFLAKLYDEAKPKNKELDFHWHENDDPVDFQMRLYNLHANGLKEFLKKEIEGISDKDFKAETPEDLKKVKKKFLKFNKLFDIKSVLDDNDFEQNHRVLKEVVKMLEKYKIRYPYKQRHLSEFFELLLTTGLKQEAGQYFTPPPVTRFIIKSLPLRAMVEQAVNNEVPKLPAVIDYAAGSGHFITEIMEEYQDIITNLKGDENYPETAVNELNGWKVNPYSWAARYIYGIEKDYRLVKVAKVGCYFYGDGLAQIIYGDGLDSFKKSISYIGLLKDNAKEPQFSVLVSNPPYSVNDCKDDLEYTGSQDEFTLYPYLTSKSKEIEVLFVERSKQLLKEGGVAGVIFPSSILSNTGIYTKAREIILQSFEIIAVVKFGSNTFMETGTNTVVLFLRRRSDAEARRIREAAYQLAKDYPKTRKDLTINGIEKPVQKYFDHTKNTTLIDPERLYYFILAYPQKNIVIINSGERDDEKRFLGYEFSKRRGNEGMHSIDSHSTINRCTKLYDDKNAENPEKASSYIYKAFTKEYLPVSEAMRKNIVYADLVDMLTFDRDSFDKNISLTVKKKVKIESKWEVVRLGDFLFENDKSQIQVREAKDLSIGDYPFFTSGEAVFRFNDYLIENENIYLSTGGNAVVKFYDGKAAYSTDTYVVKSNNEEVLKTKFIFYYLESIIPIIDEFYFKGIGLKHLQKPDFKNIPIPRPPRPIQEKIIVEIEILEKKENEAKKKIKKRREKIEQLFMSSYNKAEAVLRLSDENSFDISIGKRVIKDDLSEKNKIPVYSANVFDPFGYIDKLFIKDFSVPSVLWGIDGDWMVNYMPANKPFYPTDHCGVLRVKTGKITPKYLAWILNKEGIEQQFSRTLRASIDRIKGLSVKFPPFPEQQKIVSEVEAIEEQIAEAQKLLDVVPERKNTILKKYL